MQKRQKSYLILGFCSALGLIAHEMTFVFELGNRGVAGSESLKWIVLAFSVLGAIADHRFHKKSFEISLKLTPFRR